MKINLIKKFASLLCLGLIATPVFAAESSAPIAIPQVSDAVRYTLTPYFWLVNIGGDINYKDYTLVDQKITTSQLLSSFQYGGMLEAEAHKGNWGVAANLLYASVQHGSSRIRDNVDLGATTTAQLGIYNLAATYTIFNSKQAYVDALVGARILSLDAKIDTDTLRNTSGTTFKTNATITNPIVGLKGRYRIGESDYFVPFYADVGGGVDGTQITTQGIIGIGKSFDWGDAMLVFNDIYYQFKNNETTTNLNFYGAAVGVTFKF